MGWTENDKNQVKINRFSDEITESLASKYLDGSYKYNKSLILVRVFLGEVEDADLPLKEAALNQLKEGQFIKNFKVRTNSQFIENEDPEDDEFYNPNIAYDLCIADVEVVKSKILDKAEELEVKNGEKIEIFYSHTQGIWKDLKMIYKMRGKKYQKIFDYLLKTRIYISSKILANELGYSSIPTLEKAIGKMNKSTLEKARIARLITNRQGPGYKINPRYKISNKDKGDMS